MEGLSQILWRERELLETLLFRLEHEQLVLASGRTRWLLRCANEIEAVLATIRETEVLRAIASDEAAAANGLTSNPSLAALAAAVDEPWRSILVDHRDAFVSMTAAITQMADVNRDLVGAGYRSARETVLAIGDGADTYSPDGSAVSDARPSRMVDQRL